MFFGLKTIGKVTLALVLSSVLMACGSDANPTAKTADPSKKNPVFDTARFDASSSIVDNKYFPLKPGFSWSYEGINDDGLLETIETTVSHQTKMIEGINSAIVIDRNYEDGELIEETFDWYAQDTEGYVWYMGEASADYENGVIFTTAGSWESGLDIANIGATATAGIQMLAEPKIGNKYQQEYYPTEAEDMAQVISLEADVGLANGDSYPSLKIREWNPLQPSATQEFKYYAKEVGLVLEEKITGAEPVELIATADQAIPNVKVENFQNPTVIDNPLLPYIPGTVITLEIATDEGTETTVIEVLSETKTVLGIENRVVRDRVYLDGVIIEDTRDWFAQDDNGNVWYFGEDVDNYNYDDAGVLIDITHEGAWQTGVNNAQPGITMLADPRVGDSYRQEYQQEVAEDIAAVAAKDVSITLADGSMYNTLKIREWNPLDPESGFEFKYYAVGIGFVREENEDGSEQADVISIVTP